MEESRSTLNGTKVDYEMRVIMDGKELHEMDVNFFATKHAKRKRSYEQKEEGQEIKRRKLKKSKYCNW